MNKKMTAGKLAGIIFCILAAVCAVFLMLLNSYFGGQMKTVDKYYTAVERNDADSFKACFPEAKREDLTDADMEAARSAANVLEDKEEFHTDVTFRGREKLGKEKYSVTFDVAVYNDSEKESIKDVSFVLVREKGKWVIDDGS